MGTCAVRHQLSSGSALRFLAPWRLLADARAGRRMSAPQGRRIPSRPRWCPPINRARRRTAARAAARVRLVLLTSQTSQYLTVGTPDANGAAGAIDRIVQVACEPRRPRAAARHAIVHLESSITDVRCAASATTCGSANSQGGDDYTGPAGGSDHHAVDRPLQRGESWRRLRSPRPWRTTRCTSGFLHRYGRYHGRLQLRHQPQPRRHLIPGFTPEGRRTIWELRRPRSTTAAPTAPGRPRRQHPLRGPGPLRALTQAGSPAAGLRAVGAAARTSVASASGGRGPPPPLPSAATARPGPRPSTSATSRSPAGTGASRARRPAARPRMSEASARRMKMSGRSWRY